MPEFNFDMSENEHIIPIFRKKQFSDTGNFFQDATLRLCGTLNILESTVQLFEFLSRDLPVSSVTMGRMLFDNQYGEIFAYCDARQAFGSRRATFNPQENKLKDDAFQGEGDKKEGFFAQTKRDPYVRLICSLHPAEIQPPLFCLRLRSGKDFMAGAIFTCAPGKMFSRQDLDKLHSLQDPLLMTLSNCVKYQELTELKERIVRENLDLRSRLSRAPDADIVSVGLTRVLENARLSGGTDVPVLIGGETGTGKEVIAQAVHSFSHRAGAPFVAVNCGAVPASLIDSELFGHARGAFTGADKDHKGYFERAGGGSIFLDEIGELPLEAQTRLLRVLQEKKVERVGGSAPIPVNFRLIAATHRDLRAMVAEGKFREDLYYRLRVVQLEVPPLRKRTGAVPLLTMRFLQDAARRFGVSVPAIAPGEMERLGLYSWPGNVRELRNVVEEALVLFPQGPLRFRLDNDRDNDRVNDRANDETNNKYDAGPEHEHKEDGNTESNTENRIGSTRAWEMPQPSSSDAWPCLDEVQARYFQDLLLTCHGRISGPFGAARKAGLPANTLRSRLDKLGIAYGKKNKE